MSSPTSHVPPSPPTSCVNNLEQESRLCHSSPSHMLLWAAHAGASGQVPWPLDLPQQFLRRPATCPGKDEWASAPPAWQPGESLVFPPTLDNSPARPPRTYLCYPLSWGQARQPREPLSHLQNRYWHHLTESKCQLNQNVLKNFSVPCLIFLKKS